MNPEHFSIHREDIAFQQPIGYVYFILATEFNRIKIGITTRALSDRIKELQTGSCTPLTIMGYSIIQNPEKIESWLHLLFSEQRISFENVPMTEWFHGHPMLHFFIYNWAQRITNEYAFSDEIRNLWSKEYQNTNKFFEWYGSIMGIQKANYYEDIHLAIDGLKPKRISKKDYENFSLLLTEKKEVIE